MSITTSGLFDLQVNGYAGVDFNNPAITPDALDHALEAMTMAGVTGCLPTIITAYPDQLAERLAALDHAVSGSRLGALMVPGYHLEGPFLHAAPGYAGCHPPGAMSDPDAGAILALQASLQRPILMVTLAPERTGAIASIRTLRSNGVTVSIGHSAAGYAQVAAAVSAGASCSTHLGNGLPPLLPKLDNTLLAQLATPGLVGCFIADGHHIPPDALAALISIKGADRSILVTDAVLAAAAPPGHYNFAGMDVERDTTGMVRIPGQTNLAGSALELDTAVRNMVAWGIASFDEAIAMASDNARAAIAASARHHGLALPTGQVTWSSDLQILGHKF